MLDYLSITFGFWARAMRLKGLIMYENGLKIAISTREQ